MGEIRTISKSIPLGQQKTVDVEIKMGAGELRVADGGSELMDADFTYNVDAWKPEVRYDATGDRGTLTIQQPSGGHSYRGKTRCDWDVRLNRKVPMEMNVKMGAGKANFKLAGLNLSQFNLNVGAGEADIDLDGAWQHDLAAAIHGGVGQLTLHLPSDVGVRATVHGGLGEVHANGFSRDGDAYTNNSYGKSPVNLNIQVEGGMGEVDLIMGGTGTI
ncbi:MAG TPA: toast rack family protein [Terriglobia bacterium]|nr:toast rack family protein [Terriglobia bacterium]